MAISLKHKFQSSKADSADASIVRPSNWNDEHDLLMATSRILGRTAAGTGPAQEITVGNGLTLSGGSLVTNNAQIAASTDMNNAFLPKTGGVMSGPIDMAGQAIMNAGNGVSDYLKGLITSKTSAYVVSVAAGIIKGNNRVVINTVNFSKNLNAAWAAGSGSGGRLSAAAITASTTYHLHALYKDSDGSFDWGFDISPTAPTVPTGYTWVGRFDWCYTNSTPNAIVDYIQEGSKKFFGLSTWFTTTGNIADALSGLPSTIPVPTGIRTELDVMVGTTANAGGSLDVYVNDGDSALAQAGPIFCLAAAANTTSINVGSGGKLRTNLARQLRAKVSVANSGGAASVYVSNVLDYTLNRIY